MTKDLFVELSNPEALKFISAKETILEQKLDTLTNSIYRIKADLAFVNNEIDNTKLLV
jgi:hypothetical protein